VIFVAVILVGHVMLTNVIISSILVHFDLLKDSTIEMRVERTVFEWKKERDGKLAKQKYKQSCLYALEHGKQPFPPFVVIRERLFLMLKTKLAPFVQCLDHALVY
jgi:hypothetical protein